MANIWKRLNKLNKSNYEIAKETNIPEEKVEEIMKGERPVPTNRVDEFRKVLSGNNKAERSLKIVQAKQWYEEANIEELRKNLGYTSQTSLARAIKVNPSVVNRFEHKTDKFSDDMVLRFYDFLTDDLNKVVLKKEKITRKRNKQPKLDTDFEIVKNWYNNFNIKEWLANKGWYNGDLAKAIGYKSSSTVCDAINLKGGFEKQRNALTRIYNYISKEDSPVKIIETTPQEIAPLIEETYNKPLNFYTGEEEDIEVLDEEPTYEEHKIPSIHIEQTVKLDEKAQIMYLENELKKAQNQIARYEKLIDMIER